MNEWSGRLVRSGAGRPMTRFLLLMLFVALAGPAWADDGVGRINVAPIPQYTLPPNSCVPAACAPGSDQFGCMYCSGVTRYQELPSMAAVDQGQRRYTLDEIDRMRAALYSIHYVGVGCGGDCDDIFERRRRVAEDELRTAMTAGISPEELERKAEGK